MHEAMTDAEKPDIKKASFSPNVPLTKPKRLARPTLTAMKLANEKMKFDILT